MAKPKYQLQGFTLYLVHSSAEKVTAWKLYADFISLHRCYWGGGGEVIIREFEINILLPRKREKKPTRQNYLENDFDAECREMPSNI